jgi:SHS2 domain-containing protein
VPVTPEEFARRSVEHGAPAEMAGAVQNLSELFRAGRAGVLADDITNLTGVAPRTFREWAEHYADAFK